MWRTLADLSGQWLDLWTCVVVFNLSVVLYSFQLLIPESCLAHPLLSNPHSVPVLNFHSPPFFYPPITPPPHSPPSLNTPSHPLPAHPLPAHPLPAHPLLSTPPLTPPSARTPFSHSPTHTLLSDPSPTPFAQTPTHTLSHTLCHRVRSFSTALMTWQWTESSCWTACPSGGPQSQWGSQPSSCGWLGGCSSMTSTWQSLPALSPQTATRCVCVCVCV
jgi:hypothetical protein